MILKRKQIKELVYKCASKKYWDSDEFYSYVKSKSNDGEDLQIYNEIGFDSLDMVEFLMDLERKLQSEFKLECLIDDAIITYDVTLGNIIDYIYSKYNG